MSKSTFEAAIAAAGFNSTSTKISKTKLKAVMNEISDGIWGTSIPKYGLIKVFDALTVIGPLVEVDINYTISPFEISTVFNKNTTLPVIIQFGQLNEPSGYMYSICEYGTVIGICTLTETIFTKINILSTNATMTNFQAILSSKLLPSVSSLAIGLRLATTETATFMPTLHIQRIFAALN